MHDTDVRALVQCLLHSGGRDMSVSRCVGSEVDCSFICWYEEVIRNGRLDCCAML